jgi:hypothetical protein
MKKNMFLFLLMLTSLFTMAQSNGLIDYLDLIKNQEAVKRGDFKEITCLVEGGLKITLLMDEEGKIKTEIEDDTDGLPYKSEYVYEDNKLMEITKRMGEKLFSTTYYKYDDHGHCTQERMVFGKVAGSNAADKITEFGNYINGKPCYRKNYINSDVYYEYEFDEDGLLTNKKNNDGRKKQPVVERQNNQIIIENCEWGSDKITNIETLTYNDKKQLLSYTTNYLNEKNEIVFSYEYGSLGLLNNIKRNGNKIVTVKYK